MPVMDKLRMFVAQEPVVAASCLIAGVGLFLPAVVRPMLDSFESSKQVPQPALKDVSIQLQIMILCFFMRKEICEYLVLCNLNLFLSICSSD
ncbi:hypothetical protein Ddye_017545 [Dipteronia dyeriana]|uniref:Uncharacterized protein n=1 Tax=Dipteronia dyeriana TaxID=168575 RepID=A0AAD9X0M0_9ROSI|nr:hypothetical protein Ddye_017545 [Dipteronia dyeriana]